MGNSTTDRPTTTDAPLRRSPLHQRHAALGAKFAPFAGWEMPMEYAGGGVIAEHTAVREAVGVFDVSHMGKIRVTGPAAGDPTGPSALAFLDTCLAGNLARIGAGRAQYTFCCDPETGGVIDDLIAYRFGEEHVFLVPNAANAAEVARRLGAAATPGITVADQHEAYALIAVQGPASERVLDGLGLPADHAYMSFVTTAFEGAEVMVCRTGYTGEHGYELVVPSAAAGMVWDALFAAGAAYGIRACGLGARDTLRTEMGYPLHGQDLSPEITPVQARCGWAVGWSKPTFWGHRVLREEREAGPRRRLWGLVATGRGIPRPHMPVLVGDDQVGEVTSGTFSPTLRTGIGLALLDTAAGLEPGAQVEVDIRGRRTPMRVTTAPIKEKGA